MSTADKNIVVSMKLGDAPAVLPDACDRLSCEVERLTDLISILWEENPDNVEICRHLRLLGSYRVLQEKYSEASYVFTRLRQLLSRHNGPYDISVVEVLDWLAVTGILQDDTKEAKATLLNALAILSECPYPALSLRARILLHLGHILTKQDAYSEAEVELRQAAAYQLYWLKSGLSNGNDRMLLCDILLALRRLFVITKRHDEARQIEQILPCSQVLSQLPKAGKQRRA